MSTDAHPAGDSPAPVTIPVDIPEDLMEMLENLIEADLSVVNDAPTPGLKKHWFNPSFYRACQGATRPMGMKCK
jgi:hypothetical protein